MTGTNRFQGSIVAKSYSYNESSNYAKPCVFISYKGDDRSAAKIVAELLKAADVDVYFDEFDTMLTVANLANDHVSVVKFIEDGVKISTHVLAVISNKTKESWWVPFEVGSARRKACHIAYLALEDVQSLPSYLKVATQIKSDSGVANWIKQNFSSIVAKSYTANNVGVPRIPVADTRIISFYD
jgi:TIR domain